MKAWLGNPGLIWRLRILGCRLLLLCCSAPSLACGFHLIFPHGCSSHHHHVCILPFGSVGKGPRQGPVSSLERHGVEVVYITPPVFCCPESCRMATPTCKGGGEMLSLAGMSCAQLKLTIKVGNRDWGRSSSFCHT